MKGKHPPRMDRCILTIGFCLLFLAAPALGHEAKADKANIALDEKLGQYLPADATFADENGKPVRLKDLLDRPVIIAPVYLGCTRTCSLLLTGLAQALGKLDMKVPGRDFRVIALSFDDRDTPQIARDKKKNYLKAIGRPFPEEAWTFLTGDEANIRSFTDSIGFRFQRDGSDFSHPVTLVVISPQGRIIRYLDGVTFFPFDLTMAINEAVEGKVSSAGHRVLMYCFSYDPLKKSYAFNILKVTGTVMIVFALGFFSYLVITSNKKSA